MKRNRTVNSPGISRITKFGEENEGPIERDTVIVRIWPVIQIKHPIVSCKFETAICDDSGSLEDYLLLVFEFPST